MVFYPRKSPHSSFFIPTPSQTSKTPTLSIRISNFSAIGMLAKYDIPAFSEKPAPQPSEYQQFNYRLPTFGWDKLFSRGWGYKTNTSAARRIQINPKKAFRAWFYIADI